MDSYGLDNIKAEKAKAMQRYQTQQNLKKLLYTLEICVVLFSSIPLFFNWFPHALKIFYTHVRNFVFQFFHKTFYVFLLINAMVFVLALCFYLQRDDENEAKSDIYEELINASESYRKITPIDDFMVPEIVGINQSKIYFDKETVCSVNAVTETRHRESNHVVDCSNKAADGVIGAMKTRQEKEFRRSSTGNYRKVDQRELRWSRLGNYSTTMSCVDEPPRRSVEEMSSQEFRSKIEKFIAMQKRMQLQERKK